MGSDWRAAQAAARRWYFNPRSPDGEQREAGVQAAVLPFISIHAPRMGSDLLFAGFHCCSLISIHAPRMGSDAQRILDAGLAMEFQSTLPGWGATQFAPSCAPLPAIFQSTLPGWGATGFHRCYESKRAISIHAPRMGSDMAHVRRRRISWRISIHAPRMGSDDKLLAPIPPDSISIHAPRMGSDH